MPNLPKMYAIKSKTDGFMFSRYTTHCMTLPDASRYNIQSYGPFSFTKEDEANYGYSLEDYVLRYQISCSPVDSYRALNSDEMREKILPHLEIIRFIDENWENRIEGFFHDGQLFEVLPRELEPIAKHYVHASSDKGMVEYFANEEHGKVFRSTKTRYGRYLTQFFPHLTGDEVRDYVTKFDKANECHFASTPDDIVSVYLRGPSSCMSHDAGDYAGHVHPVYIYGAGDLSVAYLGDIERKVSARCLVWPERKVWGRPYGDWARLRPLLEAQGYSEGSFVGAKVLKIENENDDGGYVAPYIDGEAGLKDMGEHFIIKRQGYDHWAQETCGVIESESRFECPECEEMVSSDGSVEVRVGRSYQEWCSCCASETFVCDGDGNRYSNHRMDTVETANGYTYSQTYFDNNDGYLCEGSDEYYLPRHSRPITLVDTGATVSLDYAVGHCVEIGNAWYDDEESDEAVAETQRLAEIAATGQGRIEHPDQLEMPLAAPSPVSVASSHGFKIGDRVALADTWREWAHHPATVVYVSEHADVIAVEADNPADYGNFGMVHTAPANVYRLDAFLMIAAE